uniref:Putative epoxide hydrolase n=1 Tax=Talaromyces marneffei PM1 TaxID=1077442 RepID=A0A093VTQ5_TALMA
MTTSQFLRTLNSTELDRPFGQLPTCVSLKSQSCKIDISSAEITELRSLAQRARLGPATFENTRAQPNKEFGLTRSWMDEAVKTWTSESAFNWGKIQDNINSIPHFTGQVDHNGHSYSIHYMTLWSQRSDAIPLYTPETLPYHFIVPSLPGYTFSSGPPIDGVDFSTYDVSCIFRKLFNDHLGFKSYIVAGGDIGSRVCRALAADDANCIGIHLTFCFDFDMCNFPRQGLENSELRDLATIDEFIRTGAGYAQMHATRSSTIGFVLSSSPVAFLAWIAEKYIPTKHISIQT